MKQGIALIALSTALSGGETLYPPLKGGYGKSIVGKSLGGGKKEGERFQDQYGKWYVWDRGSIRRGFTEK